MKAVFRFLEDDESPILIGIASTDVMAILMVKNSFVKSGTNVENYLTSDLGQTRFGVKAIDVDSDEDGIYDWSTWEILDVIPDKPFEGKPCSFVEDFKFLVSLQRVYE